MIGGINMAWYYGTYICGHEGRTNIVGPSKDRERKADWHFSGFCPECYKKQLQEEKERKNKEAAEKSAEMELPELTGTEKQVAWANSIRINVISDMSTKINKLAEALKKDGLKTIPGENIGIKEISDAFDYFINNHVDAKYWIEHREVKILPRDILEEYKRYTESLANEEALKEIEKEESMLTVFSKSSRNKPGIVKIQFNNSLIFAEYIKDDDFKDIVKKLHFCWKNHVWQRDITEFTGSANDRMAELGNKLLLNGFTVCFPTENIKNMAVTGKFEPETDRWVVYDGNKKLCLAWNGQNDTLYQQSKKLPGARWESGKMAVPVEFYKELNNFAETLGFSVSQRAKQAIREYKKKETMYIRASINMQKEDAVTDEEKIKNFLKSNGTIIEDLIDN